MDVLVIKLGALGDVVMATPLVRRLAEHHAGEPLTLLTTPPYLPLFGGWPDLEVMAFPRRGLRNTLACLGWLRRRRFDRIYDLQSSDRSGLLCALSGARERVGNHPRYPYDLHPATPYEGQTHIFERMNEVLAAAGVAAAPAVPFIPPTAADVRAVDGWLDARGLGKRPFAVLHAGASPAHPEKCWPFFAALAESLAADAVTPVLVGGPEERERNRCLADRSGFDASGAFSLTQLAELGRRARFAVTNDSGPMHVFAASGIPVYGLFGPTNWRRNHALGQAARVITRQPLDVSGKRLDDPAFALSLISAAEVVARLRADGCLPA